MSQTTLNIEQIRADFPILRQTVKGQPLVYLDNAATSQKPQVVIDAITHYYERYNSNIHRGAHHLAHIATEAYEAARQTVASHLNAEKEEINFTSGTTEGINLVAHSFGKEFINEGDEIIVSEMEHHSNIVPWQLLCKDKKAVLKVIPFTAQGELVLEEYYQLLSPKTKLVSVAYISNALGTIHPVKEIIHAAHSVRAKVLIDAAQALPHKAIDVRELDCDFLAFSGHKLFAATGIGVLYGKKELLQQMPPYKGGGEMIKSVSFAGTTFNELPYKFEAGTPNIEGGISLGAALNYINNIGLEKTAAYEHQLLTYGTEKLLQIKGLRIIGTATHKASVLSFLVDSIHPYDLGVLLNEQGIAIRTGHHCCQPLMERLGIEGTCRASLAFYNTFEELDLLAKGIEKAIQILS